MSDTMAGVQKYVRTNGAWRLAYNFAIPKIIPEAENNATGCFGLVVDFTGSAPIIYATTTEGYGGCVNSNRIVRIVDTNATAVAAKGETWDAFPSWGKCPFKARRSDKSLD